MSRWFRFYAEALNDPKVQKLDGETFKGWVNLLCIASQNEGKLPALTDVAFALRIEENAARTLVERLSNATLIDRLNGGVNGVTHAMHGWDKRQYKSDTSNERVKRYRQRSKSVTETAPETEADTDKAVSKDTGAGAPLDADKVFWATAIAYLGEKRRSAVGKWVSKHGREATATAIAQAQVNNAVDPVAYIEKVLRRQKQDDWEFTGPC